MKNPFPEANDLHLLTISWKELSRIVDSMSDEDFNLEEHVEMLMEITSLISERRATRNILKTLGKDIS